MSSDAFSYDALWNKSKIFVDKALRSRDDDDIVTYHLWASIALELLGKAVLAKVHPALVADPSNFKSLLAACGKQITPSVRSITAGTLYERLHLVCEGFDEKMAREAAAMAARRNAELHSGESPIVGLDARVWVPSYWRIVATLLSGQGRALADWVGAAESNRVKRILADSAETLRQTVLARIERRRREFEKANPAGTQKRNDAEGRARVRPAPYSPSSEEEFNEVDCPACGLRTWVFGLEYDREIVDRRYDYHSEEEFTLLQTVNVYYGSEDLNCDECGLTLEGVDEIEIADLPATFEKQIEEEPEYEPEYGNE